MVEWVPAATCQKKGNCTMWPLRTISMLPLKDRMLLCLEARSNKVRNMHSHRATIWTWASRRIRPEVCHLTSQIKASNWRMRATRSRSCKNEESHMKQAKVNWVLKAIMATTLPMLQVTVQTKSILLIRSIMACTNKSLLGLMDHHQSWCRLSRLKCRRLSSATQTASLSRPRLSKA